MRTARLTFPGAWHHVMNRAHGNHRIFNNTKHMREFLGLLKYSARLYGIRLVGYCLLWTHYHLLLQNVSGKLSDFMKYLNSTWAIRYHTAVGGRGYLFQWRFKSTLIQENSYLETALIYILLNPVRAGLVKSAWDYKFSSIHEYFAGKAAIIDAAIVREIYPAKKDLDDALEYWMGKAIAPIQTRIGPILGSAGFIEKSLARFDKRMKSEDTRRRRIDERAGKCMEAEIIRFEKKHHIQIDEIDVSMYAGKRLRAELLVRLHEDAGMKYSEIIELPLFKKLKLSSLGSIFYNAKRMHT